MTQKQAEILRNALSGVIGDDSEFWNEEADIDVEKFSTTIKDGIRKTLAPNFKAQYMGEYTGKLVNGLAKAGAISEDDNEFAEKLKGSKADEIPTLLVDFFNSKQKNHKTDNQKTVAEQVEAVKKIVEQQYQAKLSEIEGQLNGYKAKESEAKITNTIKKYAPAGLELTEKQIKAVKSIILDEADIVFDDDGKENLFHKGTDYHYGTMNAQKTLIGLDRLVPDLLKELKIYTEKPQPQKFDFSKNGNNGNGNKEEKIDLNSAQGRIEAMRKALDKS